MFKTHFHSSEKDCTRVPRLPSTVVAPAYHAQPLNKTYCNSANYLDTSPLTAENYNHIESRQMRYHNNPHDNNHAVRGNHHTKKNTAHNQTQSPSRTNTWDQGEIKCRQSYIITPDAKGTKKLKSTKEKKSSSQQNSALTWRMDPSESLSDFCLVVIGINDKDAIKKRTGNCNAENPSQQRRKKWNVDGLYLDPSESEDDGDDGGNEHEQQHGQYASTKFSKVYTNTVKNVYHLHKTHLAVGPRRCEYFSNLFKRQRKYESRNDSNGEHLMELPLSCISAISSMFDYIYGSSTEVNATTETAVALRYLATIFGNRSLFDSATDFIQHDLRRETAFTYLIHSNLYRQKKLFDASVRICAEEFHQTKIQHLAMLPPNLMERILHSKHFQHSSDCVISSKVAAYCRCHENNIDGKTLLKLTDVRVMPEIHPDDALFFIKSMISSGLKPEEDSYEDQNIGCERFLYERCIDAAPPIIHDVIHSLCNKESSIHCVGIDTTQNVHTIQNKKVCADYSQLPSQVKVDLLECTLAKQHSASVIGYDSY